MAFETARGLSAKALADLQHYMRAGCRAGAPHLIFANLLSQALGMVSSLFVVHFLAPAELADFRVIATYLGYAQIIGSLGLNSAVLAFVPRQPDQGVRRWWLAASLTITVLSFGAVAAIAASLSRNGLLMRNPDTAYWYRWSLAGGLAACLANLLVAYYQAEKDVRRLAGFQTVARIGIVGAVVLGAAAAGFKGYLLATIGASWVLFTTLAVGLPRGPRIVRARLPSGFIATGVTALLGTVLWTAGRTADVVLLDRFFKDRNEFGCYALALTVAAIVGIVNSSLQVMSVPHFAARIDEPKWILRQARRWQVAGAAAGVLTAAGAFGLSWMLVSYFYGAEYQGAIAFLVPLLLAQCALSLFHIQAAAIMAIGLVRLNTLIAAIVVPLSAFGTYVAVTRYGIWGAAWSQVLSALAYAVVQSTAGWSVLRRGANRATEREAPSPTIERW